MKLEGLERIPIWGTQIPGNSGESKMTIMHPDESLTMEQIFSAKGGIWDKSTPEITSMVSDDTLVLKDEIRNGYAEETFSDEPFLIPYLVPGSDKCVISCPGGAYLSKSLDNEGSDIADFLNKAGISCFVLWYRTYPNFAPTMYLDCQRAVRFVRYHAKEYGIDPNKISTIGFSAGGNLVSVEATVFGNKPVEFEGYTPDEIDAVDGMPNAVGMGYPAISMFDDKIVACIAGVETYNDIEKRNEFAAKYYPPAFLTEDSPQMFITMNMDDFVIPVPTVLELVKAAHAKKVPCELHIFPSGGHGFGACVPHPMGPFEAPDLTADEQWMQLYINWLNRIFE